eukprot:scaffold4744_cov426-Prasinococcus_capsulatus_cf.AAC.8
MPDRPCPRRFFPPLSAGASPERHILVSWRLGRSFAQEGQAGGRGGTYAGREGLSPCPRGVSASESSRSASQCNEPFSPRKQTEGASTPQDGVELNERAVICARRT